MRMMACFYRNPNSNEGIGLRDGVWWTMDEINWEEKR